MRNLELVLLGGCEVRVDGVPVSRFRSAKAKALLVYLSLQSDSNVRFRLQNWFWPDIEQSKASGNFRQTLARLKLALNDRDEESPFIIPDPLSLESTNNEIQIDVVEFQNRVETFQKDPDVRSKQTILSIATLAPLEEAVSLYNGHFLENDNVVCVATPFEQWAHNYRRRMEEQICWILELLSTQFERRGNYSRALDYAYQLKNLNPLVEHHYRRLMLLEARNGNPIRAIQLCEECRKLFKREMNLVLSLETEELLQRIRTTSSQRETNMGPLERSFVGRNLELNLLNDWLVKPEKRLVTLLGTAGIGKSYLARHFGYEVGKERFGPFMNGVFFLDLQKERHKDSSQSNAVDVWLASFVELLGIKLPQNRTRQQALQKLRNRECLLILDNLHLCHREAVDFVAILLESTRFIKVMVASREGLRLSQEWPLQLQGLSAPVWEKYQMEKATRTHHQMLEDYETIDLFVQRAQQNLPRFSLADLPEEEQRNMVRICQFVEGLPLAIEMAAEWVSHLSCREIMEELQSNFSEFLHASLPFHGSQSRLVDIYSTLWQELPEEEQKALSSLSVFPGEFSRKAASAVCHTGLRSLNLLCNKSLLENHSQGQYRFHSLFRHFLQSQTFDPQVRTSLQLSYVRYYAEQARILLQLRKESSEEAVQKLHQIHHHLGEAWQLAKQLLLAEDASPAQRQTTLESLQALSGELAFILSVLGMYEEGLSMMQGFPDDWQALLEGLHVTATQLLPLQSFLLLKQGEWSQTLGLYDEAEKAASRVLQLHNYDPQQKTCFHAVKILGSLAMQRGEMKLALQHFESCLETSRNLSIHPCQRGYLHLIIGSILLLTEPTEAVRTHLERSYRIYDQASSRWGAGHSLRLLGRYEFLQGNARGAYDFYQQSLEFFHKQDLEMAEGFLNSYLQQLRHLWKDQGEESPVWPQMESFSLEGSGTGSNLFHAEGVFLDRGEYQEARHHLSSSLTHEEQYRFLPVSLGLCFQFASMLFVKRKWKEAYPLLLLVSEHPSSSETMQSEAREKQAEVRHYLSEKETRRMELEFQKQKETRFLNPASCLLDVELTTLLPE